MDSILLSINVVFPLFVYMLLGFILKNINMVDNKALSSMNKLIYKVFLPITLFLNVVSSNITETFSTSILIYTVMSVLVLFISLCMIIPKFEPDNKKASVIIQGTYRSNFVLFGITITASICGAENMGMATILVTVVVPIFNILAVILFEMYQGTKINYKKVIKGVITNPLIIGSMLGLLVLLFKIKLPGLILIPIKNISNISTPLALIVLGGTFKFSGLKKYAVQIITATLGKLVLVPSIFLTIAILLGFRGSNLVTLMVLFASPTAVSSYSMADQMGADGELACYIVVMTSIFAIITIFGWTFTLNTLNLIN